MPVCVSDKNIHPTTNHDVTYLVNFFPVVCREILLDRKEPVGFCHCQYEMFQPLPLDICKARADGIDVTKKRHGFGPIDFHGHKCFGGHPKQFVVVDLM